MRAADEGPNDFFLNQSQLEEALESLNSLDSDEIDVEIAALPPDAGELTDKDEVNTGILLLTGYHSNTCEHDYWSDAEDLDIIMVKNDVPKSFAKVEILFTLCGQWNWISMPGIDPSQ
ncbi:hypothetical protein TNCV_2263291 [Trichonephila clavipes]|nr:hypothetical protein TNCV_2263291 [Trichonephila clavipes]